MPNKENMSAYQWNWMMDWCKKQGISPSTPWVWEEARAKYVKANPTVPLEKAEPEARKRSSRLMELAQELVLDQHPLLNKSEPVPTEILDKIVADSRKVERQKLVWEAMLSVVSDADNWSRCHEALGHAIKAADTFLEWRDAQ